jgi:hypothetical protein
MATAGTFRTERIATRGCDPADESRAVVPMSRIAGDCHRDARLVTIVECAATGQVAAVRPALLDVGEVAFVHHRDAGVIDDGLG